MARRRLTVSPDVLALNPGLGPDLNMLAIGRDRLEPEYDSLLERDAVRDWLPRNQYIAWWYQPLIFHLPSGNYTPDLMMMMPDKTLAFVEVKGWNKNLRADKRKYKEAVQFVWWARWCWLTRKGREWKEDWSAK